MQSISSVLDAGASPTPPRFLYKYLSSERVGNVLKDRNVRFTPLLNTNDSFEVRATFEKFAGPRFLAKLYKELEGPSLNDIIDKKLSEQISRHNLEGLPVAFVKGRAEKELGMSLSELLRQKIPTLIEDFLLPSLNSPEMRDKLLQDLGNKLLCFSLAERFDSAPMWAHYANNGSGFIVTFRSNHEWFREFGEGQRHQLQKVTYFDGMLEEPFENIRTALISKTTDWVYEREWRLYAKEEDADEIIELPDDTIHLLRFPEDVVEGVIVGHRIADETLKQIREILDDNYSDVSLHRAQPNRHTTSFDLEPIT